MSQLAIEIPKEIRQDFKRYCVVNNVTQKKVILDFIYKLIKRTNKESK